MRRSDTRPSAKIVSTSKLTSSMCAMYATESLSGPAAITRFPAVSTTARAFAHAGNIDVIASRTRHSCPGTPARSAIVRNVRSIASYASLRATRRVVVSNAGVIHGAAFSRLPAADSAAASNARASSACTDSTSDPAKRTRGVTTCTLSRLSADGSTRASARFVLPSRDAAIIVVEGRADARPSSSSVN